MILGEHDARDAWHPSLLPLMPWDMGRLRQREWDAIVEWVNRNGA